MFVLSISEISEVGMDFTLDMYFRQFWQDPRLSFERRPGLDKLVVGAEYIKLIWVPDTFFVNEKTAYFHDATTENQFLRILHTGEILRSIRTSPWTCTFVSFGLIPAYHSSDVGGSKSWWWVLNTLV